MKASRLRFPILGLIALALVAAGCGGSTKAGSSPSSGATMVRSGALAYLAIDSDTGSDQWKQLDALAKKFPGRDLAIAGLEARLGQQGANWNDDVKPALGPEVDVAVVGTAASNPSFAVLTQPKDEGKFKALVTKMNAQDSGKPAVYRKVGDWYALSQSQQMIDRVLAPKGGKTLADDSAYKEGLSKLTDAALVKAYVNTKQLARLFAANTLNSSPYGAAYPALAKLDSLSAALSAEDDGVRLHGATVGQDVTGGSYASKLLAEAPADALAFLTFRGGSQTDSSLGQIGGALQASLGVTGKQIAALFENETALWVRPGAVIPEVTATLQPNHPVVGLATLDKLAAALAADAGATVHHGAQRTVDFGQFAIHYGVAAGKIVITNAPGGVAGAGISGEKLPAGADFSEAKSAAGLPDSTSGFIYVDLKNAIPLLEGFAALQGGNVGSSTTANLRPLRSFLAWGASSGNTQTFDAFLEIK
jgi:Protein of unknown function (DUF3352)